ncbi:GntR family transcriptional regulator [Ornithinibacillus bavariensis]|uniref:GntR family transcriptional regulator n=1 Tax=Ornithinibacillus bavariensis TaxID=545502 RepID=A0A919XC50_9BACI|nr:GntR family transcriptional regulator [Ornithinibacillus bavariensis]GIO27858.1 GntR family transcriptional regulator [Ornithinibacillus bavariensis]HAM80365.1 GntR family transcriptional regulator [Ornithinibacillus sp.]
MLINLDFEANEPIYQQLTNQIIDGIARKELKPGEGLPSVRSLAADIGINLHTVNKAYQQLKQEGFILIHRQKGVVINPDGVPKADESYRAQLQKKLRPIIAESICRDVDELEFLELCQSIYNSYKGGTTS